MSDFDAAGWSIFVAVATMLSLVACLVLLVIASRRKLIPGDDTTGHVWDEDLRELNNPLPRWWMVLFVLTVVFSFGYLWLYPGLGSYDGRWGWTSRGQYDAEQAQAQAQMAPLYARYAALPADALMRDTQAMAIGERLFVNHCATCHGSDARGSKGFPNLADDDWLYGSDHEAIKHSIAKGRQGVMPPMAQALGSAEAVRQVAHYVLSLSGSPHDAIAAQLGRSKFGACAACHGVGGRGNPALGAPNLADKVWLHGWGEQAIVTLVNQGITNTMPAHEQRLTDTQIHILAAYVRSLAPARVADAR
jgi:cytochrome c oxidase cbb3-type subunit 3